MKPELKIQIETAPAQSDPIEVFITRWQGREGGQERANYALFLSELCDVLRVSRPDPAGATTEANDYVFERAVKEPNGDGTFSNRRIDLYKRGSFVLEAKQSRLSGDKALAPAQLVMFPTAGDSDTTRGRRGAGRAWDVLMLNAKRQAEEYARALPTSHGWPPFILVCDVGHCIEVYADFSGQGKNYSQFPDRQGFRIYLEDLRKLEIRDRLVRIWNDPLSLDQTRIAAKATRQIAERLAAVSKTLEAKNHPAEDVALFLMRCLFTMFAEDVKLLPEDSFKKLLQDTIDDPSLFVPLLSDLWRSMNEGAFAASIRSKVLRFNGNLFANAKVLPLGREEIGELAQAAAKDWREVEPAIFGTLLEQALDPKERRSLGAHYTPRAYVERLVIATVIEPLREDWTSVQATAERLRADQDLKGAAAVVQAFHNQLCSTRILDPACGTGNFLYVAMELMKRLEGEVLEALVDLGGQEAFAGLEGHTVDPHQFLGLELNPRAAAIAELVLWLGYLQWHFRTKGGAPSEPILKAFKNIEVKNAVLTWEGYPFPQLHDGVETYPVPRRPIWPEAEFIVGNPPFIGKGAALREALGSSQVEALWAAHSHINESADFVMYWWDRAAELLTTKGSPLRRFGFVTTNSITQEFSRRVMKKRIGGKVPISLVMAIPDHPWTKVTPDAAAVRIAMTVASKGKHNGILLETVREQGLETDQPELEFSEAHGIINPDLTVGADATSAVPLMSNQGLASNGMLLAGRGFVVTQPEAKHLGLGTVSDLDKHIRPYMNGRELYYGWSGQHIIDFFGLEPDQIRSRFGRAYQHLLDTVKKDRDAVAAKSSVRDAHEYAANWWRFAKPRRDFRLAAEGLGRFIATTETVKHRAFQFLDGKFIHDHMVIGFAFDDAYFLGVLSSRVHTQWALRAGGWLGVGNDPRYSKSRCFDPFPFPDASQSLQAQIRIAAEELDAFRKARQAEHPKLSLTQMYNVLEKLKANGTLTPDEERTKDEGLILILKELHERIDWLVFQAYGWPENLSDEEILVRLVMLNKTRAVEEKRGDVRWLRSSYQVPRFGRATDKQAATEEGAQVTATLHVLETKQKPSFPTDSIGQTAAVMTALTEATGPTDAAAIASTFKQGKRIEAKVQAVLDALSRMSFVVAFDGGFAARQRRAA